MNQKPLLFGNLVLKLECNTEDYETGYIVATYVGNSKTGNYEKYYFFNEKKDYIYSEIDKFSNGKVLRNIEILYIKKYAQEDRYILFELLDGDDNILN